MLRSDCWNSSFSWKVWRECGGFSRLVPGLNIDASQVLASWAAAWVSAAIEKLTSSKQNKWQKATKGRGLGDWTQPLEALCLRSIPVFPISPCMDAEAKSELWCGPLLGDWGFVVWNVLSIRSVVLSVKKPQSISVISLSYACRLVICPKLRVKTTNCYFFFL